MADTLALLLVVPPFVTGLCLVFFLRSPAGLLSGLGLVGLGTAGWVDIADNCVVGPCVEDDPFLLTAAWMLSLACLAAGAATAAVHAARRH